MKVVRINFFIYLILCILCAITLLLNFIHPSFNKKFAQLLAFPFVETSYFFKFYIPNTYKNLKKNSNQIDDLHNIILNLEKDLNQSYQKDILISNLTSQINIINNSLPFNYSTESIDFLFSKPVKYKDIYNTAVFNKRITFNLENTNNITPNMLVISNKGVIGTVIDVNNNNIEIISMLDSSFKISGYTDSSKLNVVIYGNKNGLPTVKAFHENYSLTNGERVFTSAIDGYFPMGIPIGIIKEQKGSWVLEPFEKLTDIKYIHIIKTKNETK